ncbi:extracellular solute-binding protein [Paenibacillus sp. LMG 31460]|uniref:Extracellular solute-binding protein n=1 Tax=Paenibacillus germinis TaxID=2654979 RepID=A0ABX1Z920_9BACL|nr:extracellular solute-binding protein [Paenibacillus germinis]
MNISLVMIIASSLLAGCATKKEAEQPKSTSKPFEGKKITFATANHPWADTIKTLLPDFETKTGMKVEVQSYVDEQLTQKMTVQFTSGSTTPDVFMYRPLQEGKQFTKNGYLQPMDEYVKKDASYDFNDFYKPSISATTFDGKLTGIPLTTEQEILYYRKDLIEKAGISVPKTIDELVAAVKKLHDPNNGVYGFVARGQRSALVTQVSSFLFSEGGDFIQGDKATINTPEAIKAFTTYGTLLKDYGPPGVLNMSWPQAMGVFAQGKAAFYTDGNSFYQNATDPSKSIVADKVGFATFPAGKAGAKPASVISWGLAMNAKSADKDAAWEFINWATSKEIVLKTQQKGVQGARASVWNNPEGTKSFPSELVKVIKESSEIGVSHDRPVVIRVGEAREAVGGIVLRAILGEDVKGEADIANKMLQDIIDKEKTE